MSRITKASAADKAAYAATRPVYPLYGWLNVPAYAEDGTRTVMRCAVEDLRGSWSKPDPVFELQAPAGYWFVSSYTHSLLGLNLRDMVSRVGGEYLELERA